MVVASLLRLCGHGEHDDAHYIEAALKSSPLGRDCLKLAERELFEQEWTDSATLASWRQETAQKIEAAVAQVQREPGPDPYQEDWCALACKHLSEEHLKLTNDE
jgi:pyruvate dehydrogenase E1 component alpha subunit/2-oxoisovalerate dehydrogenase E1 component alpha subunit